MKISYKIIFLFLCHLKFAVASQNIKSENNIFILDIYGNRYLSTKNNKIKTGDFLKTTNNAAILLIDNDKICFSKNSSIKIKFIDNKKKLMKIIVLKGKFIFFVNQLSGFRYNLEINKYNIENNLGSIFVSKNLNNSISIKTFKVEAYIYNNSSKKTKLNSNSLYIFSPKASFKKHTNNYKESDFLKKCLIQKHTFSSPNNLTYQCSVVNNKISCGYQ